MKTIAFNLLGIFPFKLWRDRKFLQKVVSETIARQKLFDGFIVPINYETTPQYLKKYKLTGSLNFYPGIRIEFSIPLEGHLILTTCLSLLLNPYSERSIFEVRSQLISARERMFCDRLRTICLR